MAQMCDIIVKLPWGGIELYSVGDIVDNSFISSKSRRSRVTKNGICPTIVANGIAHLFYYESFESDAESGR